MTIIGNRLFILFLGEAGVASIEIGNWVIGLARRAAHAFEQLAAAE